jgi:hypothetical protein
VNAIINLQVSLNAGKLSSGFTTGGLLIVFSSIKLVGWLVS